MHEMNTLVTFMVISGLYIALFFIAEVIAIKDKEK